MGQDPKIVELKRKFLVRQAQLFGVMRKCEDLRNRVYIASITSAFFLGALFGTSLQPNFWVTVAIWVPAFIVWVRFTKAWSHSIKELRKLTEDK